MVVDTHTWFSQDLNFKKNGRTKKIDRMKNYNYNPYYYFFAVLFGVLTAWVITGVDYHLLWGAIFGLLTAGIYLKTVVEYDEEDEA